LLNSLSEKWAGGGGQWAGRDYNAVPISIGIGSGVAFNLRKS
jgi:hypothetical protein